MTGALLSHFHSSAAIRNNPRMNERYWLRVAAEISFSLYSSNGDVGGFPGGGGAGSSSGQSSYGAGKGANGCITLEEHA